MSMHDTRIGEGIARLRREAGMTQEELADKLHVTAQAVSKWENDHSLPETALLPALARLLDTSIDALLMPGTLAVLEARFGDGLESANVARRLNRLIEAERLDIIVSAALLGVNANEARPMFLTVAYQTAEGVCHAACLEGDTLSLTGSDTPDPPPKAIAFLAGRYGTGKRHMDILHRIEHFEPWGLRAFRADHHTFPSPPSNDETEYLTLVYRNTGGIHMATCTEGEALAFTSDGTMLVRQPRGEACCIPNVPMLPPFGEGMDCSWGNALTAALQAMGVDTAYETVMGVSGACYRLAFSTPNWDYSAADGLVAYDYATPGYVAFGYTPQMFGHIEKADRPAHRARIMKEIRGNMPVLGINLRVAHEWGVLCGYAGSGDDLFCRTKYDKEILDDPGFAHGELNPYDYLYVDNWPFLLCYFDRMRKPPSAKENLLASLRVFVDCAAKERADGYHLGFAAYAAWADGLRDDSYYAACADEQLARRFSVNQFCALALYDARRTAHAYLSDAGCRLEDDAFPVILDRFAAIARLAEAAHRALDSGIALDGPAARQFWTRDMRHAQAAALDEMAGLEKEAHQLAAALLRRQDGM